MVEQGRSRPPVVEEGRSRPPVVEEGRSRPRWLRKDEVLSRTSSGETPGEGGFETALARLLNQRGTRRDTGRRRFRDGAGAPPQPTRHPARHRATEVSRRRRRASSANGNLRWSRKDEVLSRDPQARAPQVQGRPSPASPGAVVTDVARAPRVGGWVSEPHWRSSTRGSRCCRTRRGGRRWPGGTRAADVRRARTSPTSSTPGRSSSTAASSPRPRSSAARVEDLVPTTPGDGILAGRRASTPCRARCCPTTTSCMAGTQGMRGHRKSDRLIEVIGRLDAAGGVLRRGRGGPSG